MNFEEVPRKEAFIKEIAKNQDSRKKNKQKIWTFFRQNGFTKIEQNIFQTNMNFPDQNFTVRKITVELLKTIKLFQIGWSRADRRYNPQTTGQINHAKKGS